MDNFHCSRDSVTMESHLMDKAMTLEPNDLNRRDEFFLYVVHHFCHFYCDILHLYNIVILITNSVTSVNLKSANIASQNIVIRTFTRLVVCPCKNELPVHISLELNFSISLAPFGRPF